MIAWDTETRNFRWWENSAFLVSWDTGEGGKAAPLTGPGTHEGREHVLTALHQHDEHALANVKFDAHMMREATGYDLFAEVKPENIHDIVMQSRLLNGSKRASHGLDELSVDLLGPEAMEGESAMEAAYREMTGRENMHHEGAYYDVWKTHPHLVDKYAADDATHTLAIHAIQHPQIKEDPKLHALYQLEQRVTKVLYRAEESGIRVDPSAVSRLDTHYREREVQARHDLDSTLGFVPEGDGSSELLRDGLVKAGVQLRERTPTGELAVNRQALAPFADHPAVAALFEWRRVKKFQSTYLEAVRDREVVHPSINQAEAWTGRMAYRSPNLQNLPKRSETGADENLMIRSAFVPRPGMEFVIVDFEAIEMRLLAHFLGVQAYRDEVAHGDPHAKTAFAAMAQLGLVEGLTVEDFGKATANRGIRDGAKQVTYGICYGGGGPVVRDTWNREMAKIGRSDLVIDLDQARQVRKAITGAIPGFKEFTASPWKGKSYPKGTIYKQLEASMEFVQRDEGHVPYGYVRTLGGRKQWIKMEKAYVGLSGLIQGSAADVMKYAAVNVYDAMKPHGAQPILFVHDELVVECERGHGAELLPEIREAMIDTYAINPSLEVEAHITDRSYAHAD